MKKHALATHPRRPHSTARPSSAQSILRATPRKRSGVRLREQCVGCTAAGTLALIPAACPSYGKPVQMRRRRYCEAFASHHRQNRLWAKDHPEPRDPRAWFLREVAPKLHAFSLGEIAKATGLSLAACSRFRAGTKAPHPRHWTAFVALVEGSETS